MKKTKHQFSNFIVTMHNEEIPYIIVKTTHPFFENKLYGNTFLFNIVQKFFEGEENKEFPLKEQAERIEIVLYAMFWVSTQGYSSVIQSVWNEMSEIMSVKQEASHEDIDIEEAKKSYNLRKIIRNDED